MAFFVTAIVSIFHITLIPEVLLNGSSSIVLCNGLNIADNEA